MDELMRNGARSGGLGGSPGRLFLAVAAAAGLAVGLGGVVAPALGQNAVRGEDRGGGSRQSPPEETGGGAGAEDGSQPTVPAPPTRGVGRVAAQPPTLSPTVSRLISAEYLTEDERRDRRIFHGVWEAADLDTPARRARAALIAGAIGHPALSDEGAAPLDRAEGALLRGEGEAAIRLTAGDGSVRAARIRAEAQAMLGRYEEALATALGVAESLAGGAGGRGATAEDQVEAVRVFTLRARIGGGEGAGGDARFGGQADYQQMMAALANVRDRVDRLYWPAILAEAELLLEKDNPAEAQKTLVQVLSLNPSCARAWRLLGDMAVGGFDFNSAEQMAARLDMLAAGVSADDGEKGKGVRSAWGGVVRARVNARLSDPDAMSDALAPVLEAFPAMREARALAGAAQALRFDFEGADRSAADYDAMSPGAPEALYEIGRALSEARQYDVAADFLRRAHERMPSWPAPVIELGLLEMQSGRDREALEALTLATGLDPFNVRAANSHKLITELVSYATLESEHFIVRHRPGGADEVLAREMLPVLEQIHEVVAGDGPGGIRHTPPRKTVIELMPDHRWFAVRIAGMPAIHTIAASTGPVIAMEAPREGARHQGSYDWARVVRHEYVHTVTLSRTNNRIPHWFTEAAAVYLEKAPRDYSTARLLTAALLTDRLFDFVKINISFVRPERPTDRSQAYAQGHWMYEFMVERFGDEAPLKLMDQYAQGVREESAFQQVLGVSRDAFFGEFKRWAQGELVRWGMVPPEGTPTVRELRRRESARLAAEDAAERGEAAEGAKVGGGEGPQAAVTLEVVDRWLEEHPAHPDLLELAVDLRLKDNAGQPTAELAPLLERYAAARPVDPMPHRHLARMYLTGIVEGKGPEAAIPHLEYLDAREQKTPAYAAELARRYAALGDWESASAKAERATMVSPYNPEMRELAATVALKRGDHAAAERHLEALTKLEPHRELHKQRLEAVKKLPRK